MKTKKFNERSLLGGLRYIPLVLWVGFFVVSFGYIFFASFSTTREIFSGEVLKSGVHFENYIDVWKQNSVGHYFVNSILTTLIPCGLIILISAPAAYVLSKKVFAGKRMALNCFVVGMSIPQVLVVIPIYCWFVQAGLVGQIGRAHV